MAVGLGGGAVGEGGRAGLGFGLQSWRGGGNFSRFVGGMGEIFPRNYNVS